MLDDLLDDVEDLLDPTTAEGITFIAGSGFLDDDQDDAGRHRRLIYRAGGGAMTRDPELTLEQWQYELTGGARILYAIDPDRRTVWIIEASAGHPKQTEPGVRRR